MIGNDLISLQVVRQSPRAGNERFLRKVLSDSEYAWLKESDDWEIALWSMWALKESAYKWAYRQHPERIFAPRKLMCSPEWDYDTGTLKALVQTPQGSCFGQVNYHSDWLHAIVATSEAFLAQVEWQIITLPAGPQMQSAAIRAAALNRLHQDMPTAEWIPESPIPEIQPVNQTAPPIISLSHHGNLGAFALLTSSYSPAHV